MARACRSGAGGRSRRRRPSYSTRTACALIVIPRSRSRSIESSSCGMCLRASTAPVSSRMRSASVDLPWSMWAMIEKLRICVHGPTEYGERPAQSISAGGSSALPVGAAPRQRVPGRTGRCPRRRGSRSAGDRPSTTPVQPTPPRRSPAPTRSPGRDRARARSCACRRRCDPRCRVVEEHVVALPGRRCRRRRRRRRLTATSGVAGRRRRQILAGVHVAGRARRRTAFSRRAVVQACPTSGTKRTRGRARRRCLARLALGPGPRSWARRRSAPRPPAASAASAGPAEERDDAAEPRRWSAVGLRRACVACRRVTSARFGRRANARGRRSAAPVGVARADRHRCADGSQRACLCGPTRLGGRKLTDV